MVMKNKCNGLFYVEEENKNFKIDFTALVLKVFFFFFWMLLTNDLI